MGLDQLHQIIRPQPDRRRVIIGMYADPVSDELGIQIKVYTAGLVVQKAQRGHSPGDQPQQGMKLLRRGEGERTQPAGLSERFQIYPLSPLTVTR